MLGETVSHYKIIEKLGEGGMGVVYRAVDTKLDRDVAIKFLPTHLSSDPAAVKRFVHEAKTASALNHSAIGVIHEIDETGDGQTFIAMAYYEGGTLRERIDSGSLTTEKTVAIASQIASGLARAHEKGIVHRDIKPQNILLTRDGEAKIIDFGLAKLAGRTKLTKDGSTLGTAAYMSPEQARGEEVDSRSDIFSLGTILYEMLVGETPFKGEHEAALLYEIVHEKPVHVSDRCKDIPAELCAVVEKALRKDSSERYQSATEMKADLKDISDASKDITSRSKAIVSGKKGGGKNRWLGLAAAVVIVAAVIFLINTGREPVPLTASEMSLAVLDFRDMSTSADPVTSIMLTELLNTALIESCPIRVQSPERVRECRRQLYGAADAKIKEGQELEIAKESEATYVLTGSIGILDEERIINWRLIEVTSGVGVNAGTTESGKMSLMVDDIVSDVLLELAGVFENDQPIVQVPVDRITTDSNTAYEHYAAGLLAIEAETWAAAARELEKAVTIDSTFALAYFQLSRVHSGWGRGAYDPKTTHDYAERAWKHRKRLGIKDRLHLEAWRQELAMNKLDAFEIYEEMISRWPDDRQLLLTYGIAMLNSGYQTEVVQFCRDALKLYPDDKDFLDVLANALGSLGQLDEALENSRVVTLLYPEQSWSWHELGQRFLEMGLPDSAEVALRRSLDISPDNVYAQRYISYCAYYRGNVERAIELQNRIIERSDLTRGARIRILSGSNSTMDLPHLYAEIGHFNHTMDLIDSAMQYVEDREMAVIIESRRCQWLLRSGRAEEVIQWAHNLTGVIDLVHLPTYEPLVWLGKAQVALDSLDAARSTAALLLTLAEKTGSRQTRRRALIVTVEIALAERNSEAALAALDEMNQIGMYRGAGLDNIEWREAVSCAHRMAGRLDEAAKVHEEMLRVFRGHRLSHYDLGLIYEEMGRVEDAVSQYEAFLNAWAEADEGLPKMEDARKRLAKLKDI